MNFGVHFGSRGVAGEPDPLKAIAQKCEALGFEHFGMSDHVIVATEVNSAYPYSASGKVRRKVVPSGPVSNNSRSPSCPFRIRFEMAKPRPTPSL